MTGVLALTAQRVGQVFFAQKYAETRHHVETAHSLLAGYQRMAETGQMTEAAAKKEALDRLSWLRYDGDQYFWVNDTNSMMLIHPTAPALVGTCVLGAGTEGRERRAPFQGHGRGRGARRGR